jgi:hypothetical protein
VKVFELANERSSINLHELVLPANSCVHVLSDRRKQCETFWRLTVLAGEVCLSITSPLGEQSRCPLLDIYLRSGQSYLLPVNTASSKVFVSNFIDSHVQFNCCPPVSSADE